MKACEISFAYGTFSFAQLSDCNDLFISECVEGWSNNKALEIYNPTDAAIDLSAYMVIRYSNGSTSASSGSAVQLTGTLAAGAVHLVVMEKLEERGEGRRRNAQRTYKLESLAFIMLPR